MIKLLKTLMRASCIVFLLILVPCVALPQDRKEPSVPQPETAAEEPASQKPGSLIVPGQGKQEPEAAAPKPGEAAVPAGEAVEAETAPAPEEASVYIIKRGDTLWDISNALLKDPFLWPFLWKANPAITNPDLIYPGNKLVIPSLAPIERALKAPREERPKERVKEEAAVPEGIAAARARKPQPAQPEETIAEGSRLIMPEERPFPLIDKYALLSVGFINQEEAKDVVLRGMEESKTHFGYDDIVYVRMNSPEQVNIGDKFLIYTPLHSVKHPKTGRYYGKLIRGLGILQITAKDAPNALTARITLSFDTIEKNSMLTPYQEPTLAYQSTEKKAKDISGYILEVTDRRTINGQTDFVYLDKGSGDGVDTGDRFTVYTEHDERGFPKKKIGEVQVILVKERTSTAIVRRSIDTIAKGDMIDFKK